MPQLRAHGIEATLPGGFEGRIFVRPRTAGEIPRPVAQFSTFALPPGTGDFGGGAVGSMARGDIFAVLFEYGPESLGAKLFDLQGLPRSLVPDHFLPTVLRRGVPGQSGTQWFFTEAGRPFTFYAVLGDHTLRSALVPRVNDLLTTVVITEPTAVTPSTPTPKPWN
jgi:hypothetical protein